MAARLRVLVAEDSATDRALLIALLQSDPEIAVVGEARSGVDAVRLARTLRPDLITMDIQMPEMDGLEATERIMGEAPTPIVVVSSSANRKDVDLSVAATGAGALLVLEKPKGPHSPDFDGYRDRFLGMVKAMAQVKVVRRWRPPRPRSVRNRAVADTRHRGEARLVAVAASTGGPAVLQQILRPLPRRFGAPILVVQHIATGFVEGLVHWLATGCDLHVTIARHGERLRPGTVYLAPDDRHLGANGDGTVLLSDAPPIGGFRPSASFLFESSARSYGRAVAAVILTGMGSDGVAGLEAVRKAHGTVLAQDEASCVVYGMPQEAVRAGHVDAVLAPEDIALQLRQLVDGDH